MRPISKITTAFFMLVLSVTFTVAQSNPYGDNYRNEKPSTSRSRPIRNCTEPYSNKLFNRDFGSLGNSKMYHLANELQSFTKYRCLTSEQIRRLAGLFQTDRDKYDYLVYSLNYAFDIENYAMTGTVLANRNARDGFYRLLVREGIPAGDYFNDYYANAGYYAPPPVYVQPRQNQPMDNSYNNYPDPRYNNSNQTPQYNNSYTRNDNAYPDVNSKGINSGYQGLMSYKEFATMKERVKLNTLENGKLETAKMMTRENVLTAAQVAEITRLFTFDNNRLDFAKFAFEFTYDRENYTVVSDALAFQKNREDLLRFTQQQRR